jgi:hypothetical protein
VFTISANSAQATTAPTIINKWCLTQDGDPITTNVKYEDYSNFWYSSFNPDTGCWTSNSSLDVGRMIFDSTTWVDGSHTFVLTATDSSGRTATSSTLTVNNTNTAPTVAWATTNNTTKSGVFTIGAVSSAAPSGTAKVTKWCLTRDGDPVTTNVKYEDYSNFWYSTFNSTTGCWTNNNSGISEGSLNFNSAAWTNGLRTYVLTVTDTSGRSSSTDPLNITTSNPQPTVKLAVGIETVEEELSIARISMYHPGADGIKSVCFQIDSAPCTSGSETTSKDSITTYGLAADTRMWKNGKYTISASITDTESRTMNTGSSILEILNPAAKSTAPKVRAVTPKWNQKTITVYLSSRFDDATNAKIFWGTNPKKLKSSNFSIGNWDRSSFKISSLKPKTTYYFKTTAIGPNGSGTSPTIKLTTPKIPPKPRPQPQGVPNVVGSRLDIAMSVLGSRGYSPMPLEASGCERWAGIWDYSHWWVVYQSGTNLYSCKP